MSDEPKVVTERIDHLVMEPVLQVAPSTAPAAPVIEKPPVPTVETDPTILAAQADAAGNMPAAPVAPVEPVNGYVQQDVTLEGLFDATLSEAGIPEDMGLKVIHTLNEAFGGNDLPRATEMAEQYMGGRQAMAQLARLQLINDALPSYDRYPEVMAFAESNKEAADAYNAGVEAATGPEDLAAVLRTLNSTFEAYHGGNTGTPVQGGAAPAAPLVELIGTRTEYLELVADPRHETDPTYRRGLSNRLAASIASGKYNSEA